MCGINKFIRESQPTFSFSFSFTPSSCLYSTQSLEVSLLIKAWRGKAYFQNFRCQWEREKKKNLWLLCVWSDNRSSHACSCHSHYIHYLHYKMHAYAFWSKYDDCASETIHVTGFRAAPSSILSPTIYSPHIIEIAYMLVVRWQLSLDPYV